MFFRKQKVTDSPREKAWQAFAQTLDLRPAQASVGMMRILLNEPIANITSLYKTEVISADKSRLNMFFLDYKQLNSKHVAQLVSVCLLSVPKKSFMSLKVSRKPHKVMQELAASASGGFVVPFEHTPFSDAVTVYARDPGLAQKTLHAKARDILQRALYERNIAPVFLMGEKVLLFSNAAPEESPTPLESLEGLAADLLSLYAALSVASDEQ